MSKNTYPVVDRLPSPCTQQPSEQLKLWHAHELRNYYDDPRIYIGIGTYGNPKFILYSKHDRIKIGRYCSIADNVTFLAGGEHQIESTSTFPFNYFLGNDKNIDFSEPTEVEYKDARHKGPIQLGNDVWIGYGAMILSGVTIGNGAIVGASSVVAKNLPPFSIAAGNPAKIIRNRFDDKTIEELQSIAWWNWNRQSVAEHFQLLRSPPADLIKFYYNLSIDERSRLLTQENEAPPAQTTQKQPSPLEDRDKRGLRSLLRTILTRLASRI